MTYPKNLASFVDDFEQLLQYVAENKVVLTPKQSMIPLRHVKAAMKRFQLQESDEHRIGNSAYKKRDEMEYSRFYFLDLLAVGGAFLKITNKNTLAKGPNWNTFFTTRPEERGFLIFHAYRYGFNFENWLLRGGDFAAQIEEKSEIIWARILRLRSGQKIEWKSWAQDVIRESGIRWNSIDQTHAGSLAAWGLECCFISTLEYLGLLVTEKVGKEFPKLQSFQITEAGCEYFYRILTKSGHFIGIIPPFCLN